MLFLVYYIVSNFAATVLWLVQPRPQGLLGIHIGSERRPWQTPDRVTLKISKFKVVKGSTLVDFKSRGPASGSSLRHPPSLKKREDPGNEVGTLSIFLVSCVMIVLAVAQMGTTPAKISCHTVVEYIYFSIITGMSFPQLLYIFADTPHCPLHYHPMTALQCGPRFSIRKN